MNWPSHGGDEFLEHFEGEKWTWIRDPPRCVRVERPMWWHFLNIFPGNVLAKRKNDTEYVAQGDVHRAEIYEKIKGWKFNPIRVNNPMENVPAIMKGHIGKFIYSVREELSDPEYLGEITGLEY
jgi:hypothetical protein